MTFTKELDGVLGHIQQNDKQDAYYKTNLPFVKTPANLAIQAIEMTPLGITGKIGNIQLVHQETLLELQK